MEVEFIAGIAELWDREQRGMRMIAFLVVAINGSVLLLSAAGIHAMMSFTVARRWREIGIRVALGADARRVLMGIFGRASAQIATGVAAGLILAGILEWAMPSGGVGRHGIDLLPAGRGGDVRGRAAGSGGSGAARAGGLSDGGAEERVSGRH